MTEDKERSNGKCAEVSETEFRRVLMQRWSKLEAAKERHDDGRFADPQDPDRMSERYGATLWELAFAHDEPQHCCPRVLRAVEAFQRARAEEMDLRASLAKRWMTRIRSMNPVRWEDGKPVADRGIIAAVYRDGLEDWLAHDARGASEHIITKVVQSIPIGPEVIDSWCLSVEQTAQKKRARTRGQRAG